MCVSQEARSLHHSVSWKQLQLWQLLFCALNIFQTTVQSLDQPSAFGISSIASITTINLTKSDCCVYYRIKKRIALIKERRCLYGNKSVLVCYHQVGCWSEWLVGILSPSWSPSEDWPILQPTPAPTVSPATHKYRELRLQMEQIANIIFIQIFVLIYSLWNYITSWNNGWEYV